MNIDSKFLGNKYAITEKYQIFPIYSLTVKRNEYFVLWRDPNSKGKNHFSDFLKQRKLFCLEKAKMNIYFESSTEEALKFLLQRQYNKVILITSIGLDLSGKKFVEKARDIIGNDVITLFLAYQADHLNWIKDFKNAIFSNEPKFYEEYLQCFENRYGMIKDELEALIKRIENHYQVKYFFW